MVLNPYRKLFLFLTIVAVFISCSKKSNGDKDTQLPLITITSPLINQVYTSGEHINIAGSVSDNTSIAEVHIHVTNNATGVKYLDVHLFPGTSMTPFFNQDLTAVTGTNYKIEIIAVDRSANEGRLSILVSCN